MIILFCVMFFSELSYDQNVNAQRYPEHDFDYSDYGDYAIETDIFGKKIFATTKPGNLFRKKIPENTIRVIVTHSKLHIKY